MLNRSIVGLLLYLLIQTAYALDSDADQPAVLDADDMEMDFTKGTRIYRGNVIFTQGSIRMNCDKLVTYLDDRQALEQAICTGDPARFKQQPEEHSEDVKASALKITLHQTNDLVILDDSAKIEQKSSIITGKTITYNLATKKTKVTGGQIIQSDSGSEPEGSSRVRMVIQPKKKKKSE